MNQVQIEEVIEEYNTGQFTIKELAKQHGVSTGFLYYRLRDNGCKFIRKHRHPESESSKLNRAKALRGRKLTQEQIEAIRERNSCNYNGLNGYGHTKKHNGGYVLAYAPKHPRAHKDGYVMLHTVIMEQTIGRYLQPNEVVHHINHNRMDNRVENLMLMDKHEHMTMHMKERWNDLSITASLSET